MSRTRISAFVVLAAVLATLSGCNAFHLLTFSVTPAEGGEIRIEPNQSIFFAGTRITIEAIPNDGWEFRRWIGQGMNTTANPTQFRVYSDQVITAQFGRPGQPTPEEGEVPPPSNFVVDGGFESGPVASPWVAFSSTGSPIICTEGTCGTLNDIGPATGAYWAWLGNDLNRSMEYASLMQNVTLTDHEEARLSFNIAIPEAENPFNFFIFVNSNVVFSLTEADAPQYTAYRYEEMDISDVTMADSALLSFIYSSVGSPIRQSAVFIDNVGIFLN